MMGSVMKFVTITSVLIAMYLLLTNAKGATSIIGTISGNALKGVGVLQGRQTNKITI